MSFQVVWEKVALTREGEPEDTILKRGQTLPDWVSEFMLGVLTSTGAVRAVDDGPIPAYAAPTARESELPPSVPTGPMPKDAGAVRDPEPDRGSDQGGDGDDDVEAPATSAHKATWVNYAVSKGMSRNEADGLSKEALINRFGK